MKKLTELNKDQKDALKFVLEVTNPNDRNMSITVKDLREIDKICRLIEGSGESESLEFEDADFDYLKQKFDNFTAWNPEKDNRQLILMVSDKLSK